MSQHDGCVVLPDGREPQGAFRVVVQSQQTKGNEKENKGGDNQKVPAVVRAGYDYEPKIAKLDAARFLLQEAILPTLHRQVVILGGEPPSLTDEKVASAPSFYINGQPASLSAGYKHG
jgi:hypothetical protein